MADPARIPRVPDQAPPFIAAMPVRLPALVVPALLSAAIAGSRAWMPMVTAPGGGPVHAMNAPAAPHAESDAATVAPARIEAHIAMLDARFAAEPVNADWATREEAAFRRFLAPDAPRGDGLRAPQQLMAVCHSATCRISARYADPLSAEIATQQLALQFADALPYGAVLPRALADGSIQIDAWYSSRQMQL